MATTEILVFAQGVGANVESQAAYAAETFVTTGFQAGIAPSAGMNKLFLQTSLVAAMVGQFIADNQANNVVDSLTPVQLEGYFASALRNKVITVVTPTSDADITLSQAAIDSDVVILNTGAWTSGHNTIVSTDLRMPVFANNSIYSTIVKTLAGTGEEVPANGSKSLLFDGSNVVNPLSATPQSLRGFRRLTGSANGISANLSFNIEEAIVEDTYGNSRKLRNVALAIDSSTIGANGLDVGPAIAANTFYYIYAIWNKTTNTVAGILSLSATGPALPSGYTHWVLINATLTDGTANAWPLSMQWIDDRSHYVVNPASNVPTSVVIASNPGGSLTTPTWIAVSVSSFVPSIARSIFVGPKFYGNGGATMLAPNSNYGGQNSTTNPPPMISGIGVSTTNEGNASQMEMVLESSNIYAAGNAQIVLSGWRL